MCLKRKKKKEKKEWKIKTILKVLQHGVLKFLFLSTFKKYIY